MISPFPRAFHVSCWPKTLSTKRRGKGNGPNQGKNKTPAREKRARHKDRGRRKAGRKACEWGVCLCGGMEKDRETDKETSSLSATTSKIPAIVLSDPEKQRETTKDDFGRKIEDGITFVLDRLKHKDILKILSIIQRHQPSPLVDSTQLQTLVSFMTAISSILEDIKKIKRIASKQRSADTLLTLLLSCLEHFSVYVPLLYAALRNLALVKSSCFFLYEEIRECVSLERDVLSSPRSQKTPPQLSDCFLVPLLLILKLSSILNSPNSFLSGFERGRFVASRFASVQRVITSYQDRLEQVRNLRKTIASLPKVSVAFNQPSTINHPPSIINHQPSTINHQSSIISHQPSTINHQPSIINHQPSTINHQSSIINHQPSTINHQPSINNHQPSAINHQSSTINHQSPTINHQPSIIRDQDQKQDQRFLAAGCEEEEEEEE